MKPSTHIHRWNDWKKEKSDTFIYQVQKGRTGQNVGLGNGLKYINQFIYGTHPETYYLVGADSGAGKTTLTDFMYVLKAYEDAKEKGIPIHFFYCSFEVSRLSKEAKWTSFYIFLLHGIRLPLNYILGRIQGNMVSDEHIVLIQEAYDYVLELMNHIGFVDIMLHPTAIYVGLVEWYGKHGKITREVVSEEKAKKGEVGKIIGYEPNDPNIRTLLIIDHIALSDQEQNLQPKANIDRLSKYCVTIKKLFKTTIIVIQQFSTDLLSANRTMQIKKTISSIAPTRQDFGDSKATFRDAEVVFGITCPGRDLPEYMGWDLSPLKMGQCLIVVFLMKTRDGISSKKIPLFMDGASGHFYDLPCPMELAPDPDFWYSKAQEISGLCQVISQQGQ